MWFSFICVVGVAWCQRLPWDGSIDIAHKQPSPSCCRRIGSAGRHTYLLTAGHMRWLFLEAQPSKTTRTSVDRAHSMFNRLLMEQSEVLGKFLGRTRGCKRLPRQYHAHNDVCGLNTYTASTPFKQKAATTIAVRIEYQDAWQPQRSSSLPSIVQAMDRIFFPTHVLNSLPHSCSQLGPCRRPSLTLKDLKQCLPCSFASQA